MNKLQLIVMVIGALMKVLTPELIKGLAQKTGDTIFDYIETKVLGSASTVDDAVVLPILKQLRDGLNIPDNDE